ncbi:hypothetical protein BH23PAT1_BH23PAT1_3340 [soil metagenome]
MADEPAKKRRIKKTETLREQAARSQEPEAKPRRLKRTTNLVGKPLKSAKRLGKKEYYLPLPDNKIGRFLNKRRSPFPSFLREAWRELLQVTWPNAKETARFTFAVIIFAFALGALIAAVDFGLEKLFREVILR